MTMAGLWSSAITDAWSVVRSLLGDFMPVLGIGLGLAILGALWMIITSRKG